MKKLIIATTVTTCIALCAAVWVQSEMVEETPTMTPTATVCAAEATNAESEAAEFIPTEYEITAVAQMEEEELQKSQPMAELEPELMEIPVISKVQPVQERSSVPESAQEPAPTQTARELHPGDLVYVPGFG